MAHVKHTSITIPLLTVIIYLIIFFHVLLFNNSILQSIVNNNKPGISSSLNNKSSLYYPLNSISSIRAILVWTQSDARNVGKIILLVWYWRWSFLFWNHHQLHQTSFQSRGWITRSTYLLESIFNILFSISDSLQQLGWSLCEASNHQFDREVFVAKERKWCH